MIEVGKTGFRSAGLTKKGDALMGCDYLGRENIYDIGA